MKKFTILYFIILIVLCACGSGGGGSDKKPEAIVDDPYIPPIVEPEPEDPIGGGEKYVVFSDSNHVKFFDGSSVYIFKSGKSSFADGRKVSIDSTLYTLDQYGDIQTQQSLAIEPDFTVVDLDDNVWTGIIVTPESAYENGRLYTYYFDVYKNNVLFKSIQTQISNMFLSGTDVIAVNISGTYYDISGTKTGINYAGEFTVYDFNSTTRTAKIDGVDISWSTNYFNGAKSWAGSMYSWNGYRYEAGQLYESGSCLTMWRNRATYPITLSENAVVISAGYSVFNGETHYFFIECNSGWLFKYIPSSDSLIQLHRLYTGDGMRSTGINYSKTLNPVCGKDGLYFIFDGGLYRYRFDSEQVGFIDFCSGGLKSWN